MDKKYSDIFFDLDNTLWDFDKSSINALKQTFERYKLDRYFDNFEQFYKQYEQLNHKLWDDYRKGKIDKDQLSVVRFLYLLEERTGEVKPKLAEQIANTYLAEMTKEPYLETSSFQVLKELSLRGYRLHIITDGFLEVQLVKLKIGKISSFINTLVVSEEIGVLKPDKRLFDYALDKANAQRETSIFVGNDYENDILGAYNAGLDQVFYNRNKIDISQLPVKPTYTITSLDQLLDIF